MGSGPLEQWKVEEVRTYLQRHFPTCGIEHYAKGGGEADLFVVLERRGVVHQVLILRRFFDRFTDHPALRDVLTGMRVACRLEEAGEKTVELC